MKTISTENNTLMNNQTSDKNKEKAEKKITKQQSNFLHNNPFDEHTCHAF